MNYLITEQNYHDLVDYLYSIQDLKYQKFHKSLLNDDIEVIGIRVPILRKIALEIAKNTGINFLNIVKHDTYEEILLHGLVLGYLKIDFDDLLPLLDEFLKYNSNWAINDITVTTLKIFKKNLEKGFIYIKKLLKKNSWSKRFGLVLLLTYYINDEYIDEVIKISMDINSKDYYVLMANAWLISICYIKYPEKIEPLILNKSWDIVTLKKAIGKIKDSYRVTKEDKEKLNKFLKSI